MIDRPTSPLGPTLETERLFLRPPTLDDFPRWAEFQADPDTTRFIGGPQSKHQVWRTIASVAGMWALHGEGMFSVIEKATGLWMGRIGPLHPYDWPGREVGWSLHPDATGKGYAIEAAVATTPATCGTGRTSSTASTRTTGRRRRWRNGWARPIADRPSCRRPSMSTPSICGARRGISGV